MLTKTKTNTNKVDTWLPIFSGFYETIWESDSSEEFEIYNINEERAAKGLSAVTWDAVDFDYAEYNQRISEDVASYVSDSLIKLGLVSNYKFQKLSSPREYNFYNDHIDVEFTLSLSNKRTIRKYLQTHKATFTKYVQDHYTSYDGFSSNHSNNADVWLADIEDTLTDTHKLGAVLNFILLNEEGSEFEMTVYADVTGNTDGIHATNYDALVGNKQGVK